MAKKASIAGELGERIRNLRRQKKITLIELSKTTGVAQATLSRMETGLMIGTVKSHQKIAEALGISLAELYGGIDTRYDRIRHQAASGERKIFAKTDQMRCELLTQEISKKKITPLLITLNAHGKSETERLDRGVEKLLFVLEGTVTVHMEGKEYILNSQDTLYFDGSIPHQLANTGNKQAKIFCAVSPSKI
ncbi:MAG: helix-turn-helix transcriptional regulator [Candidatus Omnitrophica bacterium]|nr:helix-turn-helix transcriptional regulator [Candidatus Omnitrophota bacterium]